jgi:hypothetical protein
MACSQTAIKGWKALALSSYKALFVFSSSLGDLLSPNISTTSI